MQELVARAKFHRQVDLIQDYIAAGRSGYQWKVLKAEGSRIVVEMEHPGREALVLRVLANDWDEKPASFLFVDGADSSYNRMLPPQRWPGAPFNGNRAGPFRDDHRRVRRPQAELAAGRRPFICLRGTREFDEDQRHQNEPWEQFRSKDNFTILAMLIAIQEKIHDVTRAEVAVRGVSHG